MVISGTLLMLMATGLSVAKIIDLSHNHDVNTFMAAGMPHYNHTLMFKGEFLSGVYLEYGSYFSGEHGGTHMDAPRHFYACEDTGNYLHEIPLEKTILTGVMIDCSSEVKGKFDYVMPLQRLRDWEEEHGRIPDGAAVIINYGWSHRFHDRSLYVGSSSSGDNIDDLGVFKYPTVSYEAAEWLLKERDVMILGTDTMAPDMKKDKYHIHVLLLTHNRLIVENVRDPGRLPPRGFRLHAAPVKFVGASGAQIRLYAMTFDEDGDPNTAQVLSPLSTLMACSCFLMAQLVW